MLFVGRHRRRILSTVLRVRDHRVNPIPPLLSVPCCLSAVRHWHASPVVVVIAQQLVSYRQLSRLRKSATAAGLSHRSCTVSCVGWLWQLHRCATECGATPHSGQTSDMPLVIWALFKSRQWPERNWITGPHQSWMSSVHLRVGRPQGRLRSIQPSSMCVHVWHDWNTEVYVYRLYLLSSRLIGGWSSSSTEALVRCSVQLTLNNLQ